MRNFKEGMAAPTIVLVAICLVISFALAFTYQLTSPTIEAINKSKADEARMIVLPDAGSEGFTAVEGDLPEGIKGYFIAKNGAGVSITSQSKSFGGPITVMTGIDSEGKISGVKVTSHADTAGLGTKAMTPEYLSQYKGLTELDDVETIKNDSHVDAITGATVSSNGIFGAVKTAIAAYQEMGGIN